MTPKYNAYLQSEQWQEIKERVWRRDRGLCCKCGRHQLQVRGRFEVHHLTYDHCYNEQHHLTDLVLLCPDCHEDEHKPNMTIAELQARIKNFKNPV